MSQPALHHTYASPLEAGALVDPRQSRAHLRRPRELQDGLQRLDGRAGLTPRDKALRLHELELCHGQVVLLVELSWKRRRAASVG